MIAFIDVGYNDDAKTARAACLTAGDWTDEKPLDEFVLTIAEVQPYQSGEFYKRELPCVAAALNALPSLPTTVVIDGYVWLDSRGKKGLGGYLFEQLKDQVVVIGVAKTRFATATAMEVFRGASDRPLFVTAAGTEVSQAAKLIQQMHGKHRLPTLLRRVDQLSRS